MDSLISVTSAPPLWLRAVRTPAMRAKRDYALLPVSTRHNHQVESRTVCELDFWGQDEAMAVPDRIPSLPGNMKGRIRKARQNLKWAGEVALIHVRKNNGADFEVGARIVGHFEFALPILNGLLENRPNLQFRHFRHALNRTARLLGYRHDLLVWTIAATVSLIRDRI